MMGMGEGTGTQIDRSENRVLGSEEKITRERGGSSGRTFIYVWMSWPPNTSSTHFFSHRKVISKGNRYYISIIEYIPCSESNRRTAKKSKIQTAWKHEKIFTKKLIESVYLCKEATSWSPTQETFLYDFQCVLTNCTIAVRTDVWFRNLDQAPETF